MKGIQTIEYKYDMTSEQFIRFHLVFFAHVNNIPLTGADLNALTLLGLRGKQGLTSFCNELVSRKVFLSVQSTRNALSELCMKKGMITKEGRHRKTVVLSDDIGVSNTKPVLLDIKCLCK